MATRRKSKREDGGNGLNVSANSASLANGKRSGGRPRGRNDPTIPWLEIEHAYIHGVAVDHDPEDTSINVPERKWPTFKQLGERYGCSASLVHQRAKRYGWRERRETFKEKFKIELDAHLAQDLATSTAAQVAILDRFTALFSRNLAADRVRADNIVDLDKALRLREFLLGNADTRSESTVGITLDAVQARHKAARTRVEDLDAVDTGLVDEPALVDRDALELNPPPPMRAGEASDTPPPACVADSCETRQPLLDAAREDSEDRPRFDPLDANASCRLPNEANLDDAPPPR